MELNLCASAVLVILLFMRVEAAGYVHEEIVVKPNPEYPGKCFDESTNATYDVGQIWYPERMCTKYQCDLHQDGDFRFSITGCRNTSAIEKDPYCTVHERDLSLSYLNAAH